MNKNKRVTVPLTLSDTELLYLNDNMRYESTDKKSTVIKQYSIPLLYQDIGKL